MTYFDKIRTKEMNEVWINLFPLWKVVIKWKMILSRLFLDNKGHESSWLQVNSLKLFNFFKIEFYIFVMIWWMDGQVEYGAPVTFHKSKKLNLFLISQWCWIVLFGHLISLLQSHSRISSSSRSSSTSSTRISECVQHFL